MHSRVFSAVLVAGFLSAAGLASAVAPEPQDAKSAPLARQLAQALDAAKLDSIAAADPSTGAFVAALYSPILAPTGFPRRSTASSIWT